MVGSLFITMAATASEVVSTNIVGYVMFEGISGGGWTFVAPPFISVTNDVQTYKLSSVIKGNFTSNDTLQFYDKDLKTELVLYWGGSGVNLGWHTGFPFGPSTYRGKTEVPAGTGFLVKCANPNVIVTFPGIN